MTLKSATYLVFFCLPIFSFFLPSIHDYALYLEQWHHILKGNDPWRGTLNAYGPVYSFMALLVKVHERLPALLFLAVYFFSIYTFCKDQKLKLDTPSLIFLIANPLFLIFGVLYSNNDVLLAGLILLFLDQTQAKNFRMAGVILGLAISFKFSVIFLVPILFLQEKKWFPRSLVSLGMTVALLYGISYLIWGDTFIIPFLYGTERGSRLLSVFRFIRGNYQPLKFMGIFNLDKYNTLILGGSSLVALFLIYRQKIQNAFLQAAILLTTVFMIYKVGNHQYFLTVFPLLAVINQQIKNTSISRSSWILLGWYSLATLLYHFTRQEFQWGYSGTFFSIREWIGLPTFIVQVLCLFLLFKGASAFKQSPNL